MHLYRPTVIYLCDLRLNLKCIALLNPTYNIYIFLYALLGPVLSQMSHRKGGVATVTGRDATVN